MATKREPKKPSEKVLHFEGTGIKLSGRACDLYAVMTAFKMAAQQERNDKHLKLHEMYETIADEIDEFLIETAKKKLKKVADDEES